MLSLEATNTKFIGFGLTQSGSNPQSTTLEVRITAPEVSMLTLTPPMWLSKKINQFDILFTFLLEALSFYITH
jgi:hypothetical protein